MALTINYDTIHDQFAALSPAEQQANYDKIDLPQLWAAVRKQAVAAHQFQSDAEYDKHIADLQAAVKKAPVDQGKPSSPAVLGYFALVQTDPKHRHFQAPQ